MVEMTLPIILQIIQTVSLVVGIIYYLTIMRNAQNTRQTEMFMRLYQSRSDKENSQTLWDLMGMEWENLDEYYEKYSPQTNPEDAATRIAYWSMLDSLGMLVTDKVVDKNTVYRMMGRRVMMIWYKFETVIKDTRVRPGGPGPGYMEELEVLAYEMIEIAKKKGHTLPLDLLHSTSSLNQDLS
jgi:hypothetical protein